MCIAIPPPMHQHHSIGRRWWNQIWRSPLRLLGFGAGIQLAGWLLLAGLMPDAAAANGHLLPLLWAVITLLLGVALERIPAELHADEFHYPTYGALFGLTTAGALLALVGIAAARTEAVVAGTALLLLALGLGGRALWWKIKWLPAALSAGSRVLLAGLGVAGAGSLGATYLFFVGS